MIEIINGDCLEYIKGVKNGYFDCIIYDPPYTQEAHDRGIAAKREVYKAMAEWTNLKNDWYNENILDELIRICKFPNIFLFCAEIDLGKIYNFADSRGLHHHTPAIDRQNPPPLTNNTWLPREHCIHIVDRKLTYSKRYDDKLPTLRFGGRKETNHPNEKPRNEITRIIRNITQEGDKVFDPFLGSGTTALCCQDLNRDCIGVEVSSNYCQLAQHRLDIEKAQLDLFK